jgi:hypothetical protein
MPATEIEYNREDGSISITQHSDEGDVVIYFPVQMAAVIASEIQAVAAQHDND